MRRQRLHDASPDIVAAFEVLVAALSAAARSSAHSTFDTGRVRARENFRRRFSGAPVRQHYSIRRDTIEK